jgi:hypothetical protein
LHGFVFRENDRDNLLYSTSGHRQTLIAPTENGIIGRYELPMDVQSIRKTVDEKVRSRATERRNRRILENMPQITIQNPRKMRIRIG